MHWKERIKVSYNHLGDFFCNINLKYEMCLAKLQNANKFDHRSIYRFAHIFFTFIDA